MRQTIQASEYRNAQIVKGLESDIAEITASAKRIIAELHQKIFLHYYQLC